MGDVRYTYKVTTTSGEFSVVGTFVEISSGPYVVFKLDDLIVSTVAVDRFVSYRAL